MNDAFLRLYEEELGHIRDLGGEFAAQYPKIAGRLGMSREGCEDPFVERMIEGFAFLAARVRAKLDAEYHHFAEALLESAYPQLLGPVPSMTIVEFTPDENLAGRFVVPRGATLTSHLGGDEDTRCEFRTAHEVVLQPLTIPAANGASYHTRDLDTLRLPASAGARAAIRIHVHHRQAGKSIASIEGLDGLTFHLAGNMDAAGRLYEEICAHCTHIVLRPAADGIKIPQSTLLARDGEGIRLTPMGFAPEHSLLPADARTFDGYRLLREYATLPQRFMFLRLDGPAFERFATGCEADGFEVILLLGRDREELARMVDGRRFRLHATPAINLFHRRADQIRLTESSDRAHVVVDKTRPLAYEVYQVLEVNGMGERLGGRVRFEPFYRHTHEGGAARNFFTVRRERRKLTHRELRFGARHDYAGSEVYLYLVDADKLLHEAEIDTLAVSALCTNRHIPLSIPVNQHATDFFTEAGVPIARTSCLVPPTIPVHSPADGAIAWSLVSQLSLNYLALVDNDSGAAALRGILELYSERSREGALDWTKTVVGVRSRPIIRRHLATGPVAFVRGLEVTLTLDDSRLVGHSSYTLGSVLARFLARHVSINSFVETVVETTRSGVIGRWDGHTGTKPLL